MMVVCYWLLVIGMFKGNAECDQMAAQWPAERENNADKKQKMTNDKLDTAA